MSEESSAPACAVFDDPETGGLVARMPGYITGVMAAVTSAEIAKRLAERGTPRVVVVDLYDVEDQDVIAPLVAIKGVMAVVGLIERIEIIVRRQTIRIAATTAAHILGLNFTVRSHR
jgi:hypothetical protein